MTRLLGWFLNLLYLGGIFLALPWLLWSAVKHGKYREGFAAKLLGHVPPREGQADCVWLHAVSVGEVNLLGTLINALRRQRPGWELVISTTTKTGYDLARKKYSEHTVFYCPLDLSWATAEAMRRVGPKLLVLAELELWPNLIQAAHRYGARIAIVNGRLSDRSTRGYLWIRPLIAHVLRRIAVIAAQDEQTARRFRQLGAHAVVTTGSLKFDGAQTERGNQRTRELGELAGFTPADVVLLAGSTQAPEEAYAIGVYQKFVAAYPELKLVLVPRHPQRFQEVAQLLDASGLAWRRRSQLGSGQPASPEDASADEGTYSALLVDSVGELGAWWGLASIGFVGGSFGSRGGQNMLEPAAYGVPTCFGPHTRNFRDIVAQLTAAEGAVTVPTLEAFEQFVGRALQDPAWAAEMGHRARQLVLAQQGATERTVEILLAANGS